MDDSHLFELLNAGPARPPRKKPLRFGPSLTALDARQRSPFGTNRAMQYLALKRSWMILVAFAITSLLLVAFPGVDLYISGLFYRTHGFGHDVGWLGLVRFGLMYFLYGSLGAVVTIYAINRVLKRNLLDIDGRKIAYLLLVLVVGCGLIVNLAFKEGFGRARPRDVAEFGGSKKFTPAFVVAGQCKTNCSFSSGEVAGAFFSIALVMALGRRRALFPAALAVGGLMSLARISSGAHFFSDAVVSFFVMWIVADVLYYYIVLTRARRKEVSLEDSGHAQLELDAAMLK